MLGATGTIGRATLRALLRHGHEVVCFVRPQREGRPSLPAAAEVREGDVSDAASLRHNGFRGESFDVVVSCMASRTGAPADAWAIDHAAHLRVLEVARESGVEHFVLLSAICVQKPRLAFQQAKLAFERALMESGIDWSIIRPTAFFKSLSGQINRVRAGKPFLYFGDGEVTACKPIGDDDLAEFLAGCLVDPARLNRVLPIGGPGPALTARQHGELLFEAVGMPPRYRSVPVGLLRGVVSALSFLGRFVSSLADKAELARIGHYYATESMLVWDPEAGRYNAEATPEFGIETLGDYYGRLARGEVGDERGDHALF